MDYKDYKILNTQTKLHFWYKARLTLIKRLLTNVLIGQNPVRQILDIGCGTGTELKILKQFGQVTALDIEDSAVTIAKKQNIKIIQADIENYQLPTNQYDVVCCFDVLEHLKNDCAVLKNIYRSLKTGGYFLTTVPACQLIFSAHDLAVNHYRRYAKKELKQKLTKAGFKIIALNYWNFILFLPQALVRLGEKIFLSTSVNKKFKPDTRINIPFVNFLLYKILHFESCLMPNNFPLPFGLSLYAISKKP